MDEQKKIYNVPEGIVDPLIKILIAFKLTLEETAKQDGQKWKDSDLLCDIDLVLMYFNTIIGKEMPSNREVMDRYFHIDIKPKTGKDRREIE